MVFSRIQSLLWLLLLLLLGLANARRSPRGHRAIERRKLGVRVLQMYRMEDKQNDKENDDDDDDKEKDDDDDNDDKEKDDDDDDDEDDDETAMAKEQDIETPTLSPTRVPTAAPTTESPTTPAPATPAPTSAAPVLNNPRPSLTIVESAEGDPLTGAPTDAPVQTPIPATTAPVMGAPRPTISTTSMPTISSVVENPVDLLPETESVTVTDKPLGNATDGLPYTIQLEPLYIYVSMQGDSSEEDFMEVLLDYMEYNMARDFEGFQSITYGVSTFSMITKYPSVTRQSSSASFADMTPTSNITAHIHLLTATFESQPDQPDLVITEYMEMLLENEVMMQSYLDSQPGYDATILNVTLEFEDTLNPTEVVATSPTDVDGATAEEEEPKERKDNTMAIVGWTVGSFFALLWVVYLFGVQSRPYHSPQ